MEDAIEVKTSANTARTRSILTNENDKFSFINKENLSPK